MPQNKRNYNKSYKFKINPDDKQVERHRKMSIRQASIYRDLERLVGWWLPISMKMPKVHSLEFTGDYFLTNVYQAMTSFSEGYDCLNISVKKEFLDDVKRHFDESVTAIDSLFNFSSLNGQTIRIVSHSQYGEFLLYKISINNGISAFRRSLESSETIND